MSFFKKIILDNREQVIMIAERLLEKETITAEEIATLFDASKDNEKQGEGKA